MIASSALLSASRWVSHSRHAVGHGRRCPADQGRPHGQRAQLATAVGYGLLVSLLFALWPLGRAEQVRAGVLFATRWRPSAFCPRWHIIALTLAAALLLVASQSSRRKRAISPLLLPRRGRRIRCISGASAIAIAWAARRVARPRRRACTRHRQPRCTGRTNTLRRAVAGRRLVSVGHGGTRRSLHRRRADRPPAGGEPQLLRPRRQALGERGLPRPRRSSAVERGSARRRCCAAAWSSSAIASPRPSRRTGMQWALNGDRGLTYSQGVPEGSTVVAGQWWPADYAGEPLVSFEAEIAKAWASRSATTSPSTCWAATSPPRSPTCAR